MLLIQFFPEHFPRGRCGNSGSRGITGVQRFARGLVEDRTVVEAGLTPEWSNGQTEGQVNELELLKRQTYGGANFDLLWQRMLRAA